LFPVVILLDITSTLRWAALRALILLLALLLFLGRVIVLAGLSSTHILLLSVRIVCHGLLLFQVFESFEAPF
jgi:hypothetical protein